MATARRSRKPKPKVAAAAGGGTVATALIAIGQQVGIDVPPEVAGALVTLASFAAGYRKTESRAR